MVEINEGGTAVMSPEEMKQERARRDLARDMADAQRIEQQKRVWHAFSYALPVAALVLGASFVGIAFFVAFRIMGDAWTATNWGW